MTDCLFCKIIAGKIPSKKVYEDEKAFAFEDIKPQAPTHVLIIPKKHIVGIDQATEADAELVGYCQLVAAKIAKERKLEHGFRTVYNVARTQARQFSICTCICSGEGKCTGRRGSFQSSEVSKGTSQQISADGRRLGTISRELRECTRIRNQGRKAADELRKLQLYFSGWPKLRSGSERNL
jgi:histidine triad (HIT) family protein